MHCLKYYIYTQTVAKSSKNASSKNIQTNKKYIEITHNAQMITKSNLKDSKMQQTRNHSPNLKYFQLEKHQNNHTISLF